MIESPHLEKFVSRRVDEKVVQTRREDILSVLENRFDTLPEQIRADLDGIKDQEKLRELMGLAARCPDLESFRAELRK